ncbi:mandelate racemase/muconate lactonizing enzyme family protein [Curvibacter sp. CHRR-16]|uniref:mandelate racemase/muconate lactonizing enzyme family protein n=1 Tax=Curvibacter sp. CHRR-16 TaxID=2835872 RepID=UPI001BDA1DDE|nr:mandelate racemase/muconate lactonizing enzyme family protein [Curvibacter sp. CHRR-16]MBT0570025.1 mandelate racemase/muconate lactonizing enzyme family protein [Curvibacter sp. CHRR-16]
MKASTIRELRLFEASSPLSRPIADATHQIGHIGFLVLELVLHNGVRGQSYLLSFDYSHHAIRGAVRDIAPMATGWDAAASGSFIVHAEQAHEYFGQEGVQRWALGLVNIAMWDAWARHLNVPMHQLWGSTRTQVPVYGSGGWLSYSDAELVDEVRGYVERGFRAVKIKVGSPNWQRDIERLRLVREAVGPHVQVMMDANQGCDLAGALALAHAAKPWGIRWFEEPLHHHNVAGFASLRAQAGISLAMGEREYDTRTLQALIAAQGIDMWQPDLLRLGSVQAWRDSAALAHAHHLPVLPHYYRDYDVPLLCTITNGLAAESFDWIDGLIDTPLQVRDGMAYPRETPGWGFRFREPLLKEIAV